MDGLTHHRFQQSFLVNRSSSWSFSEQLKEESPELQFRWLLEPGWLKLFRTVF
jgi:hypothetical protein